MSILSNSRHITLLDKQFQTELDIVIYFKHYSFSLHYTTRAVYKTNCFRKTGGRPK